MAAPLSPAPLFYSPPPSVVPKADLPGAGVCVTGALAPPAPLAGSRSGGCARIAVPAPPPLLAEHTCAPCKYLMKTAIHSRSVKRGTDRRWNWASALERARLTKSSILKEGKCWTQNACWYVVCKERKKLRFNLADCSCLRRLMRLAGQKCWTLMDDLPYLGLMAGGRLATAGCAGR